MLVLPDIPLIVLLALIGLGLYFFPSILAVRVSHPQLGKIFLKNLLLWSLLPSAAIDSWLELMEDVRQSETAPEKNMEPDPERDTF